MVSDAELCSLLPDSRSAGAWRSGHHVVLQKRLDSWKFLEPQPPLFLRHLYVQRPHAPSACVGVQVCLQHHVIGYVPVEMVTFPHKTMEQKVRTEDNNMCFCSQHEYTVGSQYEYSLGWCNTKLLAHQAGQSDTCF